ncbi:integrase, catalytic region, zinc finger, CCHC-type containing protein [Tanacetum coccineum]
MEPEDSLNMGDEHLSTIPKKESNEVIKSSVNDLVPIPSEFENTFESDGECDLSSCEDFSPINVFEEKSMTFSNPLFDSNDDFTSSNDESLSVEDVPEDNVKIYSNPLFKFDDEYISGDVNPLFDEVLEDIEREDSYVSKLDEPDLLVTPLSAFNEDECFDSGGDIDEIDAFLDIVVSTDIEDDYYDSKGDIIYLESLLIKDTTPITPRVLGQMNNSQHVDLLTGSRGDNLYTLSLGDMMASSPICLLSKASKTKSWLWHRHNGTEFVNQTLREYYEQVGISHETSVARSPQQNGIVERRNHTLIEAASTMLIYSKTMLFLWAEAVAIACYTKNRSMIRQRHSKTPYELLHNKPPDLSFLYVFGALCYPTNDSENLGKLQPKADVGIFIGYAPMKKAF